MEPKILQNSTGMGENYGYEEGHSDNENLNDKDDHENENASGASSPNF